MSDLDDDLLDLLETGDPAPAPKRVAPPPRSAPAAKKRRKAKAGCARAASVSHDTSGLPSSGSDMEMSDSDGANDSEAYEPPPAAAPAGPSRVQRGRAVDFMSDDESAGEEETPEQRYPYRGLYKSRDEYKELHDMTELDREAILGQRQEEIQKYRDRQSLKQMVADQAAAGEGGRGERVKKQTGRTEAKASALDKLKKQRSSRAARAADDGDDGEYGVKTRSHGKAKPTAEYSDYTSDEDAPARGKGKQKKEVFIERADQADIKSLLLERWRFVQNWAYPWFEEYVKGAWVRVAIGVNKETGGKVYRLCEVAGLDTCERPYCTPEDVVLDLMLLLRMGKAERLYSVDLLSSNVDDLDSKEYLHLLNQLSQDGLELPTKKDVENKLAALGKRKGATNSEQDVAHALRTKNDLKKRHGLSLRRPELLKKRADAKARKDLASVARIEEELNALEKQIKRVRLEQANAQHAANGQASPAATAPPPSRPAEADLPRDALALINERNRLANRTHVRKAELGQRAPKGGDAPTHDPSARVKTNVRLLHDVSAAGSQDASRAASPAPVAPAFDASKAASSAAAAAGVRLEQAIASKVEVDLGDF